MNWWIERARPEIVNLPAYKPAVWNNALVRLNANENPFKPQGDPTQRGLNHYPEPYPSQVESMLAALYGVPELVVTRGADEAIDILIRAYVRAAIDEVLICPPTFAMYHYANAVQGGITREVPLTERSCDVAGVVNALTDHTKLIFLCSPNNPTGIRIPWSDIQAILTAAQGRALVVVDEAYVDFADDPPLTRHLSAYPGLVLLRTLSKSYSLAGARCGAVLAHPSILAVLKRVLPPYSMSIGSIEAISAALTREGVRVAHERLGIIKAERERVRQALHGSPWIHSIGPSETNFLWVHAVDAERLCERAAQAGLLIRSFAHLPQTPQRVRISIGSVDQNNLLIEALHHG
jgi:histidinol-phosphate aminotransferase